VAQMFDIRGIPEVKQALMVNGRKVSAAVDRAVVSVANDILNKAELAVVLSSLLATAVPHPNTQSFSMSGLTSGIHLSRPQRARLVADRELVLGQTPQAEGRSILSDHS
jgi:hypothetical protein